MHRPYGSCEAAEEWMPNNIMGMGHEIHAGYNAVSWIQRIGKHTGCDAPMLSTIATDAAVTKWRVYKPSLWRPGFPAGREVKLP